MKEFVEYLVKNIVSKSDAVQVMQSQGQKRVLIEIKVDGSDIGKVVGRSGRVIRSIRTLASSIATKLGLKVDIIVLGSEEVPASSTVEAETEE